MQPSAEQPLAAALMDEAIAALLGAADPTSGSREELSSCWGSALAGTACCSAAFEPRVGHFKNKVCPEWQSDTQASSFLSIKSDINLE